MSGSYVLIAGVLAYILLLRSLDSPRMTPVKAALLFIFAYYALFSFTLAIEYGAKNIPILPNILSFSRIVTVLLQFIVAAGIFYKVEENSDEYLSYVLWGGVGLALLFYIIPQTVSF